MREIKFRAWSTKSKEMFSAEEMATDQLTMLTTGQFINVHSASQKLSVIYPLDVMIPMQYTGLKDKNGKEIYEGDIIVFEFKGEVKTSTIKEHDSEYCYWMSLPMGRREFEVIGNIYENPELLK